VEAAGIENIRFHVDPGKGRADVGDVPTAQIYRSWYRVGVRFLVYGAGNIGSLYAARLAQSSQEVAILARGTRLDPDDAYDVVLVTLPKHRIAEVLPVLAANHRTPSVMFFGNNAAGEGRVATFGG
jgi:hypothetical protein